MAPSRRSGRSRLTLLLLVLTSLAVLTLDFRNASIVASARRGAATILSPLRGVANAAASPFSNGWNGIAHYGTVKSENDRLRAEIDKLNGQTVQGADAVEQLTKLLAEVNIPWVGNIPKVQARVVSAAVSNFSNSVDIDKGSKDGIKVGMPVVSGLGLVGRVQQVTSGRSTIELITDPNFRVGVKLLPDGVFGTARGTGGGGSLTVDTGLDGGTKLAPGGALTTSGADRSAFPSSIPVGTVVRSGKAAGGLTLNLTVKPLVDTQRLSYLTVLLWTDPG